MFAARLIKVEWPSMYIVSAIVNCGTASQWAERGERPRPPRLNWPINRIGAGA